MPTKPVPVSAIIPVYNGAAFLAEAIESILRQAYEPLEIIVVDDGSTDDSAKVAGGFRNIRYVFQENSGPPAARNRGLKMAKGDVIAFLDADDLWPETKLARQLARLVNEPSIEIIVGRKRIIQSSDVIDGRPKHESSSEPVISLDVGAALFRKSVFEKVGLFDETLRYQDDWDWFMRARELRVSMAMNQEVVLFYRRHEHNLTNRRELNDHYMMRMFKQSLDRRRQRNDGVAESLPGLPYYQRGSAMKLPGSVEDGGETE
jgi:glycosyltransferase involved in cell wall biosynthesis